MAEYLIRWEINIDADSPEEAARIALEIQRDPASQATIFTAYEDNDETRPAVTVNPEAVMVDLFEDNGDEPDPYFNDPFAKPGH